MRAALVLVILAACGGASSPKPVTNAPTASDSVTLEFAPPAVGTTYTEEQEQTLDLILSAGGESAPMKQHRLERKRVEVLEVSGDAVTRAKLTFEKVVQSQELGGQTKDEQSPIEGKTYTLTAGTPVAVDTDVGPAPAAEAEAVRAAEKSFGKPDDMSTLFAGKTFHKDEPLALGADDLAKAISDDGMAPSQMVLTFRGMDGNHAKFDIVLSLAGHDQGNDISVELTGSAVIDPKTSEAMSMDLTGTFKMSGQVDAEGTMTMKGWQK